ncbi:MAG TPA: ABC transporter substrate-binding protein [Candidatus Acidoferrales bacterium]|nr:ABC transporter substrate-binding protein [Candidatus Acidoferrales bacterium]
MRIIVHRVIRAALSSAIALSLVSAGIAPVAAADKAPVKIGLVTSKTGLLGAYGVEFLRGFQVGLDYATHGTGMAGGHKLEVSDYDDAGDAAKAIATTKDLIGQGYKIIAGTVWSGIAVQIAPLAQENNILYMPLAATDALTGVNRNTVRIGRESIQDLLTIGTILGTNLRGKRILVLAQDSAFGQANVAGARLVLGSEGATVSGLLVPLSANDFTPFAQKVVDAKPDLLFIAWAGASGVALMQALSNAGVLDSTRVVTGLDQRAAFPLFAKYPKIQYISIYLPECSHNAPDEFLIRADQKDEGKLPEWPENDGFVAAEMIVHAVATADGDDVPKMIGALDGYKFAGPKGSEQIRAADHALLEPMFVATLKTEGTKVYPVCLRTLPPGAVAPPVHPFH